LLASHGLVVASTTSEYGDAKGGNNDRYRRSILGIGGEGWSIEALEDAIEKKKHQLHLDSHGVSMLRQCWDHKLALDTLDNWPMTAICDVTHQQAAMQMSMYSTTISSERDLLPVPMRLRSRTVRRCVVELAAGRPGILVKPKAHPLEGDTSLRFGHGQWWKKVRSL